jgi:hypothetical protein
MSQSIPLASPHSIKAFQVVAQTSGSVVGARWKSGSWINSHPPGLRAAAICAKMRRDRWYFAEPFEAPKWRAQWVERMEV